ncbi:MAG TPA: DUF1134 domain-containing protein [Hyphomonadaceae bacterium]|nr:hypothetical protein AEM38_15680 [Hyphomonadaceae bacterium UKL13-1]OYU51835.1 MAG: hypothetical protein CFE27_10175 [Alphaproteobacteria bacterium PA1]HCP64910.1 DUF1134 domain-containing protein [Hyphomonadaceae bacterium]
MLDRKLAILCAAALTMGTPAFAQTTGPTPDDTATSSSAVPATKKTNPDGFTQQEIIDAAGTFFGKTSGSVGQAVERVFQDQGSPVGYIRGDEYAAAFGFGVRYGQGTLVMKDGQERKIFWQGPSIGVDTGGNASKVFTLVYNLQNPDGIYRRYPGVEGAAFFIAGIAVTYQRAEGVTLAPMRTGIGFRAGVNAGYTAYSKRRRAIPF